MLRKFFARRSARKYAERHKRLHVETDSVLQEDALADLAEKEWGKWAAFWGTWGFPSPTSSTHLEYIDEFINSYKGHQVEL